MNEDYKEYCMRFSKDELKEYMIEYLINKSWDKVMIRFLSEDGEEIEFNSSEEIGTIVFDGEEENIFISFYGLHTSIFVYDEEIMFIDESSKGTFTSSDVHNNVVYEGDLREMSHKEMLQMFSDIILCFKDSDDASVTQLDVPEGKYRKYNYYEPRAFMVNVINNRSSEMTSVYENITIVH